MDFGFLEGAGSCLERREALSRAGKKCTVEAIAWECSFL